MQKAARNLRRDLVVAARCEVAAMQKMTVKLMTIWAKEDSKEE
jgi:hypothetical protein